MIRKMLERYSHVRMQAKRYAVECLNLSRHSGDVENGIPTKVRTPGDQEIVQ
jgi:hypothetical protein